MNNLDDSSTDLPSELVDNLNKKRRCFRCLGRKKLHKMGSAYSMTDTGGPLVTCPLCNGDGQIASIESIKESMGGLEKTNNKPKLGRPKKLGDINVKT